MRPFLIAGAPLHPCVEGPCCYPTCFLSSSWVPAHFCSLPFYLFIYLLVFLIWGEP